MKEHHEIQSRIKKRTGAWTEWSRAYWPTDWIDAGLFKYHVKRITVSMIRGGGKCVTQYRKANKVKEET